MLQSASSFVASVLNGVAGPNATVCLAEHGVLLRRERGDDVQLVSGGGSGHEPAHAGFVGAGMLSASVTGEVFASPSVAAVLGAVRAVATPAGVLLIVKRYTGDRLNFGAAAERARAAGVRVAVVIVGDDVALPPDASIAGRRGLAGTLFVHKIAGAAAAAGCSLEEVAAEAESVAARVATLGVAWSTSTLPGAAAPSRKLAPGTMEVGLGIHGEEGVETIFCEGVAELVERLLRRLTTSGYVPFPSGCDVALLVNGLGGTPPCELACVTGAALSRLRVLGLRCARVMCGSLVTSLGAGGFSLSLLRIDSPRDLERLDAQTDAPAWPRCTIPPADEPVPVALPSSVNEGEEEEEEEEEERTHVRTPATPAGALLAARVAASAAAVAASEVQLSAWDAVAGDGDCGATCAAGARAVAEDAATWDFESASAVAAGLARAVRRSMGGTSGVLYDIFFSAAAAFLRGAQRGSLSGPAAFAGALEAGAKAVSHHGGAQRGMRTMVDALAPAAEAARGAAVAGRCGRDVIEAAAAAAEAGAEATRGMTARAGRSSYVPAAALATVPDPGAKAVAMWMRAAADVRDAA